MSLSFGDTAGALENRAKFLSSLGVNYRDLVCAKQVHGRDVLLAGEADRGKGALDYASSVESRDGFITAEKGLPVAVLTADCLPVFICDPLREAVGILHAGWRSTEQNICARGIELMRESFGSKAGDIVAGFGPCIRACCFEVEKGFKSNFSFGLSARGGKVFMDIALVNRRQLMECGVREENIFDSGVCTYSDEGYFSFRKEAQDAGRFISVVMLK